MLAVDIVCGAGMTKRRCCHQEGIEHNKIIPIESRGTIMSLRIWRIYNTFAVINLIISSLESRQVSTSLLFYTFLKTDIFSLYFLLLSPTILVMKRETLLLLLSRRRGRTCIPSCDLCRLIMLKTGVGSNRRYFLINLFILGFQ
jgi:hypothetical protein